MKFSDFICGDAILTDLRSTDREGAIREIVNALRDANAFSAEKAENVYDAIINREKIVTTGVGRGIAVPHAKVDGVPRMTCALAISREGLDFSSLDCEKVKIFFLLVSPANAPREHLNAQQYITRFIRSDEFRSTILAAADAEELKAALDAADASVVDEEA